MNNDLVKVDDQFYKESEIIMLDANEPTSIIKNTYKFTPEHGNPLAYSDKGSVFANYEERGYKYQHLYLIGNELTDSEAINDTFCIFKSSNNMITCLAGLQRGLVKTMGTYYEILATTDPKIGHYTELREYDYDPRSKTGGWKAWPRPSEAFVKIYCDKGGIDKVLLLYAEQMISYFPPNSQIKIKTAKDNTISIIPIDRAKPKTYSKEQVEQILENYCDYLNQTFNPVTPTKSPLKGWIKANL